MVKNSYRRQFTLPGGYVKPKEDRRTAAARELNEEVGITVVPKQLTHVYHGTHLFEYRSDTLDIFEVQLDTLPDVQVDGREVVWAGFVSPEEALERDIVPHLREYLQGRVVELRQAA